MRKALITVAIAGSLLGLPSVASAQYSTQEGFEAGAVTGGAIAGAPGAIAGGIVGGAVGAAGEPFDRRHYRHRYRDPNYGYSKRVCWREAGRRVCEYH